MELKRNEEKNAGLDGEIFPGFIKIQHAAKRQSCTLPSHHKSVYQECSKKRGSQHVSSSIFPRRPILSWEQ